MRVVDRPERLARVYAGSTARQSVLSARRRMGRCTPTVAASLLIAEGNSEFSPAQQPRSADRGADIPNDRSREVRNLEPDANPVRHAYAVHGFRVQTKLAERPAAQR